MRRGAVALAAAAALACTSELPSSEPGPRDAFFYPVGAAVLPVRGGGGEPVGERLLVASSNADLAYAEDTGGSVIGVDPLADPAVLAGGLNVRSFAGALGLADPAACPALPPGAEPIAIVGTRGSDVVYRLAVSAEGVPSCDGCEIGVGSADRGDPFGVAIACDGAASPGGPAVARAFVGYLRSSLGQAWFTQIDLTRAPSEEGHVRHGFYGGGQVRGFAYDAFRRRLYFTRTVSGAEAFLSWMDLGGDCRVDLADGEEGACGRGTSRGLPGLELRGIALANPNPTDPAARVRRAYATARIFDPDAAASAGARVGDFDGLLLVVELSENLGGELDLRIVGQVPLGYGAGDVRVLPPRAGRRDVVAAVASDSGTVVVYDDETEERMAFEEDPLTGAPLVGHTPAGLAVGPSPLAGASAVRVYVTSFGDHFVTPIDVPLDAPWTASIPLSGGLPLRIGGGVPAGGTP